MQRSHGIFQSRKFGVGIFIAVLSFFVVSGFVVRNYPEIRQSISEQFSRSAFLRSDSSRASDTSMSDSITSSPEDIITGEQEISYDAQTSFLPSNTSTSPTDQLFISHISPAPFATEVSSGAQIRVQFSTDQWDPANIERFIRVAPGITGRIEKQKTDLVFTPQSMPERSLITVELLPGIPLLGGSTTLVNGKTWSFETGVRGLNFQKYYQQGALLWQRPFYEFHTAFAPAMEVFWYPKSLETSDDLSPSSVTISVWKLSDEFFQQSMLALFRLPEWSKYQRTAFTLPTEQLQLFEQVQVEPQKLADERWFGGLQKPLPRGWYAVQADYNGERQFALLQSTDVNAYTHQNPVQNMVWAHNSRSGNPLGGANVTFLGSGESVLLDREGFGIWTTPKQTAESFLMKITDAEGSSLYIPQRAVSDPLHPDDVWKFMAWDKPAYAASEILHVWGGLALRRAATSDDSQNSSSNSDVSLLSAFPLDKDAKITLGLVSVLSDAESSRVVFDTQPVSLSSEFVFQQTLRMPAVIPQNASFFVELLVNEKTIAKEPLSVLVTSARDAGFSLDMEVSKYGVVSSTEVTFTIQVRYDDGAPAISVPLYDHEGTVLGFTDASGNFSFQKQLFYEGPEPFERQQIIVKTSPQKSFSEPFAVAYIDVYAGAVVSVLEHHEVKAGQLELLLSARALDFSSYPRPLTPLVETQKVLALGTKKLAHKPIRIDAIVKKPVLYDHGMAYDVMKRAEVPVQDVTLEVTSLEPEVAYTDTHGEARVLLAYDDTTSIDLRLLTKDDTNRSMNTTYEFFAEQLVSRKAPHTLSLQFNPVPSAPKLYEVLNAKMKFGGELLEPQKNADILFLEENAMFQKVTFKNTGDYLFTFLEHHIPSVRVSGVFFDGVTYTEASGFPEVLHYDASSRKLDVRVTSEQTVLAPSEKLKVTIETLDSTGKPQPASGVMFISNLPLSPDFFTDLFQPLESSSATYTSTSHRYPTVRKPFSSFAFSDDSSLFSVPGRFLASSTFVSEPILVTTNVDGKTDVSLKMPEREGKYFAHAYLWSKDQYAGTRVIPIEAAVPLKVDFNLLSNYFAGDVPRIRINTSGRAIPAYQKVTYRLDIPLLDVGITLQGEAGVPIYATLGELQEGVFEAVLEVETGEYREKVHREFVVAPFPSDDNIARQQNSTSDIDRFVRTYFLPNEERAETLSEGAIVFVELRAIAQADPFSASLPAHLPSLRTTPSTDNQGCLEFVETLPSTLEYLPGSFTKQYHAVRPESASEGQLTLCYTWGDAFEFGYYARVRSAGEYVTQEGTKIRVEP